MFPSTTDARDEEMSLSTGKEDPNVADNPHEEEQEQAAPDPAAPDEESPLEQDPAAAAAAAAEYEAAASLTNAAAAAASSEKDTSTITTATTTTAIDEASAIWQPYPMDVLNGRGAYVNAHKGNQTFRALCFRRKPEFDAGNHAAKRRIATEIVTQILGNAGRFLKRKEEKGPWYELTKEKAILKAAQVMRDFQRPDRLARRQQSAESGRKRQRSKESTPGASELVLPAVPLDPILENPFGVHDHDVLSGRGAFINGHVGNQRFRALAMERKARFEAGNYSEKRELAKEIVDLVRALDPPGRFLKRVPAAKKDIASSSSPGGVVETAAPGGLEGIEWEELAEDQAIHKACQVMRDIDRPDRTPDKRKRRRSKKDETNEMAAEEQAKDSMTMLAETTTAEAAAAMVQEAVAETTEQVLEQIGTADNGSHSNIGGGDVDDVKTVLDESPAKNKIDDDAVAV